MKTRLLLASKFRYLGYLLAIPGLILGYFTFYKNYNIPGFELHVRQGGTFTPAIENFTNELALTLVIIGLLLIAFSKIKREDELTAKIRIYALYWAILVNYLLYTLLIVLIIVCNALSINVGGGFLGPFSYFIGFSIYNLFTPLVIFIAIFYYLLFRNKNEFVIKPMRYLSYKPYRLIGKWLSLIIFLLLVISSVIKYEGVTTVFYLLPLTLLLWAYTKEKNEDEYIDAIRLQAMQVAIYVNYAILLVSNFSIYGWDFWTVQYINLITIPVIFIAWFQYKLYRINKQTETKPLAS